MTSRSGWILVACVLITACVTPPKAGSALDEPVCARRCSTVLAKCNAGYKAFPETQQKRCNDDHDVCVSRCPTMSPSHADPTPGS